MVWWGWQTPFPLSSQKTGVQIPKPPIQNHQFKIPDECRHMINNTPLLLKTSSFPQPTASRYYFKDTHKVWPSSRFKMAVGQNPVPLVNIKIGGKWRFIHPKLEPQVMPHGQMEIKRNTTISGEVQPYKKNSHREGSIPKVDLWLPFEAAPQNLQSKTNYYTFSD